MAHINLLPWRDERRQEQKKEFRSVRIGEYLSFLNSIFLQNSFFFRVVWGSSRKT